MTATAVVRERPLLFSGEMVRAILEGRKSQTRRVVKPQPDGSPNASMADLGGGSWGLLDGCLSGEWRCPYGNVGDRLWVRETFSYSWSKFDGKVWYWADGNPEHGDWEKPKPSIHMPRWASRLTLEITEVRVERIQDIGTFGIGYEGINLHNNGYKQPHGGARVEFMDLWNALNAKRGYGWDANPWVWVIEFKRTTPDGDTP